MTSTRSIIVHIATSADGYIARPDDDLDWLTERPKPAGFYGIDAFMKTVDTLILGRKTYEASLRLGGTFDSRNTTIVFSREAKPDAPPGGSSTKPLARSSTACARNQESTSGSWAVVN